MKKPNTYKIFGFISIGYGIVFILLDKIDYINQVERYSNILSMAYPEPIMLRIPNLIFSIALILAGYFLIHKRKENWYLFSFSFIGVLLKYILIFLLAPFTIENFLISYGLHPLIAIFGLVMINRKRFLTEFQIDLKRRTITYIILTLITLIILFFYGFENITSQKTDGRKHFKEIINDSHLFSYDVVDSCYFAHDFMAIIDTLEEIDNYSQIKILQLDSIMNPVYGERLSIYESSVLSDYYVYNNSGILIKTIKEKESILKKEFDTLAYTYYNNDKIKIVTETYYFLSFQDTMTYHYNYFKNNDTIYYSDDEGFNYSYTSYLNNSNNVVRTKQKKGIYSSGIIEYEYNSKDQLAKIIKHNQKEDNRKSIELLFYNEEGLLVKKENSIYQESSNKLESKELTIFIYKKKTKPNNGYN